MGHFTRRRSSARRALIAALSFLVMAVVACGAAGAAEAASAQPAKWVQRKIYFTYMGFTTHYSCDGLRDKMRLILLELGARKQDLAVNEAGCTSPQGGPEPFPSVRATFYALEPVARDQAESLGAETVAAHWQTVSVRLSPSSLGQAAQCELLAQVKERILPLFDARNVRFQSNCVPYQLETPGAALQMDVLMPAGTRAQDLAKDLARTN